MGRFYTFMTILILLAAAGSFYTVATQMNLSLSIFFRSKQNVAALVHENPSSQEARTEQTPTPPPKPVPTKDTQESEERTILTEANEIPNTDNPVTTFETNKKPKPEYRIDSIAKMIHSRSNLARTQNNLANLVYDATLEKIAQARSEDMIKQKYFSHTTPDGCDLSCRFKASNYSSLTWGENLATISDFKTLSEPALAQSFVDDWIKSSDHQKNLFSTIFTHEGIGVASDNTRIVVTVIFAKP